MLVFKRTMSKVIVRCMAGESEPAIISRRIFGLSVGFGLVLNFLKATSKLALTFWFPHGSDSLAIVKSARKVVMVKVFFD